MKKYIGTKQIEAEPMTMGEAYKRGLLQAGRVPSEAEKDNDGYHVKYQDGYESWSPKEPFDKAYHEGDMGNVSDGCHTFNDLFHDILEKLFGDWAEFKFIIVLFTILMIIILGTG